MELVCVLVVIVALILVAYFFDSSYNSPSALVKIAIILYLVVVVLPCCWFTYQVWYAPPIVKESFMGYLVEFEEGMVKMKFSEPVAVVQEKRSYSWSISPTTTQYVIYKTTEIKSEKPDKQNWFMTITK